MRKTVFAILGIFIVIGGLRIMMKVRAQKAPPPTTQQIQAMEGIPVDTAQIVRGDMERTVEVTGDINALDKLTLSPKIAGRVAAVYAREGDTVTPGMTVVKLDQQDALSNLQQAEAGLQSAAARLSQAKTNLKVTDIQSDANITQAQALLRAARAKLAVVKKPARSQEQMVAENAVASAKANLDNAESTYKRNKQLLDQGAISALAFDQVTSTYKVAQAQYKSANDQFSLIKEGGREEDIRQAQSQVEVAVESLRQAKANAANGLLRKEDIKAAVAAMQQARAGVALAKQQLSYTNIVSPIGGKVASRLVEPGQVVAPGQALADVVNLGSLYFKGDISERAFAGVAQGQKVQVNIDAIPGRVFAGTVAELFPAGSITNRNFPVRIAIIDAGREVRPGMFARGEIITGVDKGILLVPKDAIDERKGTQSVFVIGPKNIVKRVVVDVIRENRNYVLVQQSADLKEGDNVVTQGRQNLQDGAKVKVPGGK